MRISAFLIYVTLFKEAASALSAFNVPLKSELSDFHKGEIVGYHRNCRSLKDISKELNIPKLTVAYVIQKWKVIVGIDQSDPKTNRLRPKNADERNSKKKNPKKPAPNQCHAYSRNSKKKL